MHYLSDDFIKKWEDIVSGVEPTSVPLECIERLIIKLPNRKRKTINLQTLRKHGLTNEELEQVISRTLTEYEEDLVNVSFYINVELVAKLVQPVTDSVLKEL